jgi:hypothetical protein
MDPAREITPHDGQRLFALVGRIVTAPSSSLNVSSATNPGGTNFSGA